MKSSRLIIALAVTCAIVGVAVVSPTPHPRQKPARPGGKGTNELADPTWGRREVVVGEQAEVPADRAPSTER